MAYNTLFVRKGFLLVTKYIIMCRSLTYAQRASRILEKHGISAAVVKAPQGTSREGCSYGVRVRYDRIGTSTDILRQAGLDIGRVFAIDEDGSAREVER